jgi:hypothetical protein
MSYPQRIQVQRPTINPKITGIGYGNPRYNSMLAYKHGVLVTVGSHLRWVDIENDAVLFDQQIGCSQIFQLMENRKYILLVNFDGLITLLNRESLFIEHQFYAPGKEIRHSCLTDWADNNYLAVSCELNDQSDGTILTIYSLKDI